MRGRHWQGAAGGADARFPGPLFKSFRVQRRRAGARPGAGPLYTVLSGVELCTPFFPELNEPARPAAARPALHDAGGQPEAAGGSAVRTDSERRGQDQRKPAIHSPWSVTVLPGVHNTLKGVSKM